MTQTRTADGHDLAARVLDLLDAAAEQGRRPTLAELGDVVGHAPDHLARVFTDHVGVSPARYLAHRRADAARELLTDRSVLDAAVAAGESSPGRLHDLLVAVEAVTPGQARHGGAGMEVAVGVHASPLGPLLVATSDRGVVQLAFLLDVDEDAARADLQRRWPAATLVDDPTATADAATAVTSRLAGERGGRPLPVLLRGTNLQLAVWRALLRLPEGACVGYGDLAATVGRPRAVRAVASAVGRNPVAPVVPCHRVLRANGALGGYRWGLRTKQRLLTLETARTATDR